MSRSLLTLGSILILATVALWVADAASWIPGSTHDHWSGLTLKMGVVAFGTALLLRLVSPFTSRSGEGRCTVCGRPTERGHAYCLDHLRETVNTYRDRARNQTEPRPGPRP